MDKQTDLRQFFRSWHMAHGRRFPWREPNVDPFGILVAELMLRKTRAENVASTWPIFMAAYPSAAVCVATTEGDLVGVLAPLGLGLVRAKAVRAISRTLVESNHGQVPESPDALLLLPHIGQYSARAVACFAYGCRVPIVDGNVLRIVSRLTGSKLARDNRRVPEVWDFAASILPQEHAREHNYGLLDFAAQICTSRSPKCQQCPLAFDCASRPGDIISADPENSASIY